MTVVETYPKTENADINELPNWCIISVEEETSDLPNLSDDIGSMKTAPIDNCGVSNTSILYSSGGPKPSLDEQAADNIAESSALDQSANVIVQSESSPDRIDSFEPQTIQTAESDLVVEPIEDCDEAEIIAVENESGIVDLSIVNTDANDLTDEHDVEAKLDEHSQSANTSEGFNSCISRESNEESIVYEPPSTVKTKNRGSKDITKSQAENKTVKETMEESLVAKTNEIEKLNSSVDSRQLKSVCVTTGDVPINKDSAEDVKAIQILTIDHRMDTASIKTPKAVQSSDSDHVTKISPTTSKGDEKTPRRKCLAAQIIPVQMSPRTPRQRQVPARFLDSTPTITTPRSSKKLLGKKMTNLPKDKADNSTSKSLCSKKNLFYTLMVNLFVIFSLLRRSFT